jgi:hypothetical protein
MYNNDGHIYGLRANHQNFYGCGQKCPPNQQRQQVQHMLQRDSKQGHTDILISVQLMKFFTSGDRINHEWRRPRVVFGVPTSENNVSALLKQAQ